MEQPKPSLALKNQILRAINQEEKYRAKKYLYASLATILLTLGAMVISIRYLLQAIYQSGFSQYFSLLFSDPDVVLVAGKDFFLSLIESTPFLSLTVVLILFTILWFALRIFIYNLKSNLDFSFNR